MLRLPPDRSGQFRYVAEGREDEFLTDLTGWRRDLLDLARVVVGGFLAVMAAAVVLVPVFGTGGDGGAVRGGAVCLLLLLVVAPVFAPPVTTWCDRTAIQKDERLYVETFLGGRRTLPVRDITRVATRMLAGQGGTSYLAGVWTAGHRLPTVILTWSLEGGPTSTLVRDLAVRPTVTASRRALAHLDLPGAPPVGERFVLACRTWAVGLLYTVLTCAVSWGYAYLLGGTP